MIYTLHITSKESESFKLIIEINHDENFKALNDLIIKECGYNTQEMTSFSNCKEGWTPAEEITLEDLKLRADEDSYLMDDTLLYDFMNNVGDKMLFNHDMFGERSFNIVLKKTEPGNNDAPVCIKKSGKAPKQTVDIDKMIAEFANDISFDVQSEFDDTTFDADSADFDEMGYSVTDGSDL